MDPLGLAFENFDGIGAFRETDRGLALEVSGELDGTPFAGPRELAALLKQHEDLGPCLVRELYRFVTGHQESRAESVLFAPLSEQFQSAGFDLEALLLEIVMSDGFRLAAGTE
jgi:hypothetical protein